MRDFLGSHKIRFSELAWKRHPITNRQQKALRFFGVPLEGPCSCPQASNALRKIFESPEARRLWSAYVFTTGDTGKESPDLLPYDIDHLNKVPKLGRPHSSDLMNGGYWAKDYFREYPKLEARAVRLLNEGIIFDSPAPMLPVAGNAFCFTGGFKLKSREEWRKVAVALYGGITNDILWSTSALVVGQWSALGLYPLDNVVVRAIAGRINKEYPAIITEDHWMSLVAANLPPRPANPIPVPEGRGGINATITLRINSDGRITAEG